MGADLYVWSVVRDLKRRVEALEQNGEKSADNLKPCPFCGEKEGDYLKVSITGSGRFSVFCGACGAEGANKHDKQEAINAWNMRA